jgi:hypothetical protein
MLILKFKYTLVTKCFRKKLQIKNDEMGDSQIFSLEKVFCILVLFGDILLPRYIFVYKTSINLYCYTQYALFKRKNLHLSKEAIFYFLAQNTIKKKLIQM